MKRLFVILGPSRSGKDTACLELQKFLKDLIRVHCIGDLKIVLENIYCLPDLDTDRGKLSRTVPLCSLDSDLISRFLEDRYYGKKPEWEKEFIEFLEQAGEERITAQELMVRTYHFMKEKGDPEFSAPYIKTMLEETYKQPKKEVCLLALRNRHEIEIVKNFLTDYNVELHLMIIKRNNLEEVNTDIYFKSFCEELMAVAKEIYIIDNNDTLENFQYSIKKVGVLCLNRS